ncbi:hypothetical protein HK100_011068 [Physocladia obscura]|uniref:Trafficking protein particle complex subunit 11 domain-containing protein n=1 Tax=Physocladia obscura TaxID=109957 RepID=A0AAD5T1R6_9FUNG|nr:hypothetical protein HK100_011068 [Physocladia obscura]
MDSYPLEYILHHTALLGISGLGGGSEKAGGDATEQQLLAALLARNSVSPWDDNNHNQSHSPNHGQAAPARKPYFRVVTEWGIDRRESAKLTPRAQTSVLYPDGIMTPLWLRRHRDAAPAVVVHFLRLRSSYPPNQSNQQQIAAQHQISQEIDSAAIAAVNAVRKRVADSCCQQAKFSLVLILDQLPAAYPALESRIQTLRRACALDSRNSLFLLPPPSGSPNEIDDFVNGIQKHLYENAVNYYREHGRRIRKKKSKLAPIGVRPPPVTPVANPIPNLIDIDPIAPPAQPLNPMGWSVRYDFKMAVFAEFRQDLDTATLHYLEAYQTLIDMFHSTLAVGNFSGGNGAEVLVPFTQRWTEARTLADSISIKICKLALYADTPLPAMNQFQKHISNFKCLPEFAGDLSGSAANLSIPGLRTLSAVVPGNGSFEYWAWISKQCRVFGELIELSTKLGLRLPFPPPGSAITSALSATTIISAQSLLTTLSTASTHLSTGESLVTSFGPLSTSVPSIVVQNAGYYYYSAALCMQERSVRFKKSQELAHKYPPPQSIAAIAAATARAAEVQTDHAAQTIELLTKSYEQFKRAKHGRMTLFLAAQIAHAYERAGRDDMGLKFFERIAKTYRKEAWMDGILGAIVSTGVDCARRLGKRRAVVEGLVEMVCEDVVGEESRRVQAWEEVLRILNGSDGDSIQKVDEGRVDVDVDMDTINAFLKIGWQFFKPNSFVRESARFQVTVSTHGLPTSMRLHMIRVLFSNSTLDNLWIDNGENSNSAVSEKVAFIDFSSTIRSVDPNSEAPLAVKSRKISIAHGDLSITPGTKKIFEGQIIPTVAEDVKIKAVVLILEGNSGTLRLNYNVSERTNENTIRRKWFSKSDNAADLRPRFIALNGYGNLSTTRIIQKQPKLTLSLIHAAPILLDEIYPVTLQLKNEEDDDLEGTVEIDFRNFQSSDRAGEEDKSSQIVKDKIILLQTQGVETPQSSSSAASSSTNINLFENFAAAAVVAGLKKQVEAPISDHGLNKIDFGTIKAHSSASVQFYVRALKHPGERSINVSVDFRVLHIPSPFDVDEHVDHLENEYKFHKTESFKVQCIKALECAFVQQPRAVPILSQLDEDSLGLSEAGLFSGELNIDFQRSFGWTLIGTLKTHSPVDLVVRSTRFSNGALIDGITVKVKLVGDEISGSQAQLMKQGDTRNYVFHVIVQSDVLQPLSEISVGGLVIEWKRKQADENDWVFSVIRFPSFDLSYPDVWALLDLPGETKVGNPISLSYRIQNSSSTTMLDLNVLVEPSDAFVFSGYKALQHMRLLPLSERILKFVTVPLISGSCKLPRVKVTRHVVTVADEDETNGTGLSEEIVPLYIAGGGPAEDIVVYVSPSSYQ